MRNLRTLLKQTIDINEFNGIVGFYLFHFDSQEEIHFIYQNGQEVPTNPDVSFTTASIVKIPIMTSIFRRIDDQMPTRKP